MSDNPQPMNPPIYPDANPDDADWMRSMRNLGDFKDAEDFKLYLHERQGQDVEWFKKLPIYKRAVLEGKPGWIADL